MSPTKKVGLLTGSASLMLTSICAAAATDATTGDLQAQVAELQAQVAQLKAASGENWLTEQRATEIRSLVQDVLADADTRASLLANGAGAGWDNGFWIGSADGNFLLRVSGQMDIRFVFNNQDAADGANDSTRWGFENRRTKLIFHGHVVDPTWKYKVQGAFDDEGGGFALEDAFVEKDIGNGMSLVFGQFKVPYNREELVSSAKQLAVERSLINERFNLDRTQGIMWTWQSDNFAAKAAWGDGHTTPNTPALAFDTELAVSGRVEWLAAGTWGQFSDMPSWKGEDYGCLVGGAIHWENVESGTAAGTSEFLHMTADVSIEGGGWNVMGAIFYEDSNIDGGGDDDNPYGFMVQGGFFFTDDLEGYARFEYGDADDDSEELMAVTVGVNKYFSKHQVKWQSDIGFGLDEISGEWDSEGAGWRADPAGEDSQIVFRSQLQLLF